MTRSLTYLPISAAIVAIGCSPLVVSQTKAPNIVLNGEILQDKPVEGTFVRLGIQTTDPKADWKIDFDESKPDNLSIERESNQITVKWKIGKDHIKSFGIKPYVIHLTSGSQSYKVLISFKTTSEQIVNAVFWTLVPFR